MELDAAKADLHRYLQIGREVLVWKLEGLSEYDVRRPMTPTGTNLLGIVKHVASVEAGYLGDCFGRPSLSTQRCNHRSTGPGRHRSRAVVARRSGPGHLASVARPHDFRDHRHAGHVDIVRESIDGAAGLRADNSNLDDGEGGATWWADHCARLEAAAANADAISRRQSI